MSTASADGLAPWRPGWQSRGMLAPLTVPCAIDPRDCDRLVAAAGDAYVPAALVGGVASPALRRAGLVWLDEAGAHAWVMAAVVDVVAKVNRQFAFVLDGFEERLQIARYEAADAGHFDWHGDTGGGPLAARRKLTVVIQLTDPASYAGGVLELNPDGRIRAADCTQGSATVFPSVTLHRVTPVTGGVRHSLTTWVHGPPLR